MILTLDKIAEIIGANKPNSFINIPYSTLLTDSRSLTDPKQTIFFALRTPYNDGHKYIKDLYLSGVRAFVIESEVDVIDKCQDAVFLAVPSVIEALQKLGAYARDAYHGKVIAITGSIGKSTIKEVLYQALVKTNCKTTYRSPRSWNSQIGVPLALWNLPDSNSDIAIIEAGIDASGQMNILKQLIKPEIGVLTPITSEHNAGFKSLAEKVDEKISLFSDCSQIYVIDRDGIANKLLSEYPNAKISAIAGSSDYLSDYKAISAKIMNSLGLTAEMCENLLSDLFPVDTRIDVHEGVNNCLMVFDTFSNDITSIREALDFARRRATVDKTLTIVLGDLLHNLTDKVKIVELYKSVANLLESYGVKRMIGIGNEITEFAHCFNPVMASEFSKSESFDVRQLDINNFNSELIVIKGKHGVDFNIIKEQLEAPRHDTILEVNLDAIVHNFNHYRSLLKPHTGVIAMVKASGYGIGAFELAKTLQSQGAAYLAVAVVDEGVELRQAGITMPILVMNPITTNYRALFEYRLEPSVFSISELEQLSREASLHNMSHYPIHIKFDTGMHRLGFLPQELDELSKRLVGNPYLNVASAFSHLATADCLDMDKYTLAQLNLYKSMSEHLLDKLGYKFKRHILNTAGIQRFTEYQYDMVRLGIGLYGVNPVGSASEQNLHTVSRLRSTIISIKEWEANTCIGYSRRGCTTRKSIIATVPIGYADGIDRHFGNGATMFIVNGVSCPTIGNICMDQCMVDVTDANAKIGDDVEIFGPNMPVENLASTLGTIPYEIMTSVSPRVKRIYYRE
jgi:alanine racemase